jgi:antitoxin component YwqK of YwqJK toxin-antitoxin module
MAQKFYKYASLIIERKILFCDNHYTTMNCFKSILFTISIFLAISVKAQLDMRTCYLDVNYGISSPENAMYSGKYKSTAEGTYLETYTNNSSVLVMQGWFTDTTFAVPNGNFSYYDEHGNKILSGTFENGNQEGYWLSWSERGFISDSSLFEKGQQLTQKEYRYFKDGHLQSTISRFALSDSTIEHKYFENGNLQGIIIIKGEIVDNTNYYENGNLKFTKRMLGRKTVSESYYDVSGNMMSKKKFDAAIKKEFEELMALAKKRASEHTPEFPGGEGAFRSFINRNIKLPAGTQLDTKLTESITISFYLNEEGHATDISVINITNITINDAVVNAFKSMPRWKMKGRKNYGPVRFTLNIL